MSCSSNPASAAGDSSGAPGPDNLSVTFFSIGQGDSCLIVSPTGKRVLIDGGPPEAGDALLSKLQARGVTSLDLVLLTHPHLDHLGGLTKVVRAITVRNFLDSGFSHPSPAYTALLQALEQRSVPVKQASAGRKIDLGGGAVLTFYGPPTPYLAGTRSDVNANSAVTRLTFKETSALFSGDAEPETERWLLAQGVPLSAGLLKVAHHGGRYSSTTALLQAVRPRIAVISVGAHNDYGHPTQEAMDRLAAAGARIFRTDQDGDVLVYSDGKSWITGKTEQTSLPGAPPPPPTFRQRGQRQSEDQPASSPPQQGVETERVASRRSDVFHLPRCAGAQKILPSNLVRFPSREAALASGRRPAGDCHP